MDDTPSTESTRGKGWMIQPAGRNHAGLRLFGALGAGPLHPESRAVFTKLLSDQGGPSPSPALVLGVHPGCCAAVRQAMDGIGRSAHYLEVNLTNRSVRWNPFDAPHVGAYEMGEVLGSVLEEFFGRSRDEFWHMLYVNAVRWTIEAQRFGGEPYFTAADLQRRFADADRMAALMDEVRQRTEAAEEPGGTTGREILRWYESDWTPLDGRLRKSACTAIGTLLESFRGAAAERSLSPTTDGTGGGRLRFKTMPPLDAAVRNGSVVALNIHHAATPTLARTAGLLMKHAWLAGLAKSRKDEVIGHCSPAFLICDDYAGSGLDAGTEPEADPFS